MSKNFADNDNMTALMTAVGNKLSEKSKIFYGSETDWNNLTVAQKKEYDYWASPENDGYTTSRIITKLWQNPNTGSDFAAQQITLSDSHWNFLMIYFYDYKNSSNGYGHCVTIPKGYHGMFSEARTTTNGARSTERQVTVNSDTEVTFADANEAHGTTAAVVNNAYCIPVAIYGVNMSVTPTSSEIDYSTDEQMIGHWINGKPLYQKTMQVKAPAITTDGTWGQLKTAHNIANVDTRVSCVINGSAVIHMFGNGNAVRYLASYFDTTDISIRTNSINYSNANVYVTIQYTKTTD